MVAPVDARATFKAGGDEITLRFNFRAIALAEENGIDLLNDGAAELSLTKAVVLLKCLGFQDQPEFTEDHWLAIVRDAPNEMRGAIISLFEQYGGIKSEKKPGNARRRKAA